MVGIEFNRKGMAREGFFAQWRRKAKNENRKTGRGGPGLVVGRSASA
jgi:hypothetical protein